MRLVARGKRWKTFPPAFRFLAFFFFFFWAKKNSHSTNASPLSPAMDNARLAQVLSVLEEVAVADAKIAAASVQRHEAWCRLFPTLAPPPQATAAARKRAASSAKAAAQPQQKRARIQSAFDPKSEKVWRCHFGAVTQWVRDGKPDARLVLNQAPTRYAMTTDQMRALCELAVRRLDIQSCRLAIFAPVSNINTTLRTLVIVDNPEFKQFDPSFVSLKVLEKLTVTRCGLTALPENIGDMSNLRYINIDSNDVRSLPTSITKLPNLRVIVLTDNYLSREVARAELRGCPMLEDIGLVSFKYVPNSGVKRVAIYYCKDSGEVKSALLRTRTRRETLDVLACGRRYAVPGGAAVRSAEDQCPFPPGVMRKVAALVYGIPIAASDDPEAFVQARRKGIAARTIIACGKRQNTYDERHAGQCTLPPEVMRFIAALVYGMTTGEARGHVCKFLKYSTVSRWGSLKWVGVEK
jgi:hypothetical protein